MFLLNKPNFAPTMSKSRLPWPSWHGGSILGYIFEFIAFLFHLTIFLEILDFKQNFLLIIPKFASYIPKILNFRVVNSLSFSSVFLMRNSSLSNFSFSRFSWGNAMCSCDLWIFNGAVACTVYYELQREVYRPSRLMYIQQVRLY